MTTTARLYLLVIRFARPLQLWRVVGRLAPAQAWHYTLCGAMFPPVSLTFARYNYLNEKCFEVFEAQSCAANTSWSSRSSRRLKIATALRLAASQWLVVFKLSVNRGLLFQRNY